MDFSVHSFRSTTSIGLACSRLLEELPGLGKRKTSKQQIESNNSIVDVVSISTEHVVMSISES